MKLVDRRAECGALDQFIEAVRAGESRALVLSGEAGVGKTALLEYLAGQAAGCHVARKFALSVSPVFRHAQLLNFRRGLDKPGQRDRPAQTWSISFPFRV